MCFGPAGSPDGYDSRSKGASVIVVGAIDVPVASFRDVVSSKRAAGRPEDIVALPPLEVHLRSRERSRGPQTVEPYAEPTRVRGESAR